MTNLPSGVLIRIIKGGKSPGGIGEFRHPENYLKKKIGA